MKKLLFLVIAIVAGYFIYQKTPALNAQQYSVSKVEERPVPKSTFFYLVKEKALEVCGKSTLPPPEECREKVSERHSACERSGSANAPEKIGEKPLAKRLAREYLECAMPYPVCNGIEVRTEEEAIKYCR